VTVIPALLKLSSQTQKHVHHSSPRRGRENVFGIIATVRVTSVHDLCHTSSSISRTIRHVCKFVSACWPRYFIV